MNFRGRIERLERAIKTNRGRLVKPELILTCEGLIIFPPERAGEQRKTNDKF
jgi:hypothetical protein